MAPTTNARQIFNEIPTGWSSSQLGSGQLSDATQTGYPIPGRTVVYDTAQSIDLENVPLRGNSLENLGLVDRSLFERSHERPGHQVIFGKLLLEIPHVEPAH